MTARGDIRTGMGGWTFSPWRGGFYPKGLRQADELAYAARQVQAIEINGTYRSLQKPETFAKWAAAAPDGFVFSLKASMFCTNRRVLGEMQGVDRFFGQGLTELGDKLGPILWQFMKTKAFEPEDFHAFLSQLPRTLDGLPLRHVMEPRHDSFRTPEFVDLCRGHGVAICLADHETYPMIADVSGGLVYARLQRGEEQNDTAYEEPALEMWAARLDAFARGHSPDDLTVVAKTEASAPRDVFAFIITGGKLHAPAGAIALQQTLEALKS